MQNISDKDVGNLIQLDHDDEDLLMEFDPLVSSNAQEIETAPVLRKPSRPPPPPPTQVSNVENRSRAASSAPSLSTELINLRFSSQPEDKPVHETKAIGTDRGKSAFYINDDSSKSCQSMDSTSSFISYVGETNHLQKNIDNNVTMPATTSILMNFDGFSETTGHNQIASKLLGHREELMELFMAKRQDDYTSKKPYKVFAGTWNVNGQYPPNSVNEWTANDSSPPDLYLLGFQELDLSKEAFVFTESAREEEWLRVVLTSLHPACKYKLIKSVRLVGMMLLVLAAEKHIPHIKHIIAHQVGTGLLGKMGNKGGVAIRFTIHSSTICVVNSHLAAHAEMTQRRNEDYRDICSRLRFPSPEGDGNLTIFQHDVVIWLGDLNYRIDGMLPEVVKECIELGHFKPLKEHDQLLCQRRDGNVFQYFEEGDIRFKPTYKYNPGTDVWDTSEKCRAPAWCDRVLWREISYRHANKSQEKKSKQAMKLLEYRSHQALKISDHKPVSALFDVDVKVVDAARYRKIYEEEIRRLDRMENDWLPAVTLSNHCVEFGVVKFQTETVQTIELQNTGQMPCHFEFIGKLGDTSFCKPWLTISKPKGFIMPGDKIEIEFEVYVNKTTAAGLNSGEDRIEDILILHLVGGKDFFITLNGQYYPSCFGTSLEALCRMKKPIQCVPQDQIRALSKISPTSFESNSQPSLQVPKELWTLLDHLYHNARRQADLFQQPGLHSELQYIQEKLDSELPPTNGLNQLPGSNHSVAEALLTFLEALPEPVIPFQYYSLCLAVCEDYERSKELIKTLSSCHRCVFYYLVAFLQELPKYEKENGLNTHLIATIFGGIILRPEKRRSGIDARIDRQKATALFEKFLLHRLEEG